MLFRVEMSEKAESQYDNILDYVANILRNEQAVIAIMDDFENAINTLEKMADSFEYCTSIRLRKLELRKYHLDKHKYLLIYRIVNDVVIVEGMYHELQDYENSF